jgi:hypothetical protein
MRAIVRQAALGFNDPGQMALTPMSMPGQAEVALHK